MITNGDVYKFLCDKYPLENARAFDNPGFLVGEKTAEVSRAIVALDCDINTLSAAKENGATLIVTHHPVIFDPLKSVTDNSVVYNAVKNNISVISMHTNLDVAKGGVNDCLCKALGLESVKKYVAKDGFILRSAKKNTTADDFAREIKERLGFSVRYTGSGKTEKFLVCSGSGGDYLEEAIENGFDALIAADIKHSIFIKAINNNFTIFDCGHYASENVVVSPLRDILAKKFKEVDFSIFNNEMIKSV